MTESCADKQEETGAVGHEKDISPCMHDNHARQPRRQHFTQEEVIEIFRLRPNVRSILTAECMRRKLTSRSKQVLYSKLLLKRCAMALIGLVILSVFNYLPPFPSPLHNFCRSPLLTASQQRLFATFGAATRGPS